MEERFVINRQNKNMVALDSTFLKDPDLSFGAKGLLATMLTDEEGEVDVQGVEDLVHELMEKDYCRETDDYGEKIVLCSADRSWSD